MRVGDRNDGAKKSRRPQGCRDFEQDGQTVARKLKFSRAGLQAVFGSGLLAPQFSRANQSGQCQPKQSQSTWFR